MKRLVIFSRTSHWLASLKNLTLNQCVSRRVSARASGSSGMSRRSVRPEPRVSSRYSAITSAPGRLARVILDHDRRCAFGGDQEELSAPVPRPLLDEPRLDSHFA